MESKKIEKINITLRDRFTNSVKIKDSFGKKRNKNFKPQNRVIIHAINADGKVEFLQESKNLVVYSGREWVAERLFNTDNISVSSDPGDAIYWFGVGYGGASEDPLTPIPPTNSDTELGDETPISDNGAETDYSDWHDKGGTDYWFKHPFDSVEFEQDVNNDNEYLIVKVTTTIDTDECNFEDYNDLSEAGLFASDTDDDSATRWTLFARVTFSTIEKTESRSLQFTWYIYV